MAKISPVSAKYIVHSTIEIEGVVDRPDVIGAIFGQTEGLLGADLELRELQRSGRIGRIEVNVETRGGKTTGEIVMRGNNVMLGYYKDSEATAKAFAGGWFHSGDLAVVHPDGYV